MFIRNGRSTGKISLMVLFSGLVVFTVVMTTIIQLAAGYRAEQKLLFDTTLELNQSSSHKMAVTMNSLLRSMRSTLEYGAREASHHWEDDADVQERLDFLRQGGGMFNSILIADEDGVIRGVSPKSVGLAGMKLTSKAAQEAISLKAPYFSEPYIAATGRLIVLISEPIFDANGDYLGMLAGTVYLQEENVFTQTFGLALSSGINNGTGTYSFIVDGNGNLVFHPDAYRLGEDMSVNAVVRELMQGRDGRQRVFNTRGIEFLAGYYHVAENGWGIVTQTPVASVEKQLRHQTWYRLVYVLPACMFMLLAAVYVSRRLAAPFVYLSGIAGKLSRGERVSEEALPPGHWNREADLLSTSMRVAVRAMQKHNDRLTNEAMTDPLTGLPNRRAMNDVLERKLFLGAPFAVLVMDIDRFKSINDTYGHAVGDEVLRYLAGVVTSVLRPDDGCFRFGGEEFLVLLEKVDAESAMHAAERIRQTLERTDGPIGRPVTVSIGIADYPGAGTTAEALFEAADEAMYRAKQGGRNRTMLAKRQQ